jgi:hypothetical protein
MSDHAAILTDQATHSPFDLERLVVSGGEVIVELAKLEARELTIELAFEFHLAMRRTGESDAWRILDEIDRSAGLGMTFYESRSSDFLEWFRAESAGVHSRRDLRNFTILCADDVIDIIALAPPSVRVLDRRQA